MAQKDEQSVAAETDGAALPTSEESSAQDLDSLLSEFESETTQAEASATGDEDKGSEEAGSGEQPDEVREAVEYVKGVREAEVKQATDKSINDAVTTIQEELAQKLPARAVKGMIYEMAETNPKFVRAFQQRNQHPETWNKVLKAVAADINKDMADSPDATLTDDRKALASAVRSASSKAPEADEAPNYGAMSDAELAEQKRQLVRAAR